MLGLQTRKGVTHLVDSKSDKQSGSGNVALIEKSIVLLLFLLLVAGVFFILQPFLVGLIFGSILAVAAWPVRTWLVRQGLSGTSAAILMLMTLVLFVLMPAVLVAPDLADGVKALGERGVAWLLSSPELPAWISGLPFIGDMLAKKWLFVMSGTPEANKMIATYASPLRHFLTGAAVGFAGSMLQLAVSLIVATMFWSRGGPIVAVLRDSLGRLGGAGLARLTDVAGGAIKGVFYGVVGTAAVQGVLMAFGLLLAGVPAAVPLGFVTLLLAISQFGSVLINLVWGGGAWWLYTTSGAGFAFWFVIVWGIIVTLIDNVLKPWLIGSSIDMPITLVILGVFGGFISFGFLGLFIGPTLLAIAYALVAAWRGQQADLHKEM
jgi:predicted PurR-regulated permease PerM